MVYRGAELYGYSLLNHIHPWGLLDDAVRTLMVVYLSAVDMAAHQYGQQSDEYRMALWGTGRVWDRLADSLPPDTALVGSADHGHCDIPQKGKIYVDNHLIGTWNTGETVGS